MRSENIQVYTHTQIKKVSKLEDNSIVLYLEDGNKHIVDCLIWAVGRKPNTQPLDLNLTNIQLNDQGFIQVDSFQNTTETGVYAIGDITGKVELTPVAVAAGRRLSERLLIINQMNI